MNIEVYCVVCGDTLNLSDCETDKHGNITATAEPCESCLATAKDEGVYIGRANGESAGYERGRADGESEERARGKRVRL